MKKIILTVGPPAIGKTTWAKEQVFKSGGKIKRINKDDLRQMLDLGKYSIDNEKIINKVRDKSVEICLRKGYDVIVDDTNLNSSNFERMCEIANMVGDVQVIEKHFSIASKNELHKRDITRINKVGPTVINVMWAKWSSYKKNDTYYAPDINKKRIELSNSFEDTSNNGLPDAVIFDIDGTLALFSDRDPYDLEAAMNDSPNYPLLLLKDMIQKYYTKQNSIKMLIVTGRDETSKDNLIKWLDTHNISYDELLMRPKDTEHLKDAIIKETLFLNHIKGKYNVIAVFDDRDQTVEKWRELGLPTYQVWYGSF